MGIEYLKLFVYVYDSIVVGIVDFVFCVIF